MPGYDTEKVRRIYRPLTHRQGPQDQRIWQQTEPPRAQPHVSSSPEESNAAIEALMAFAIVINQVRQFMTQPMPSHQIMNEKKEALCMSTDGWDKPKTSPEPAVPLAEGGIRFLAVPAKQTQQEPRCNGLCCSGLVSLSEALQCESCGMVWFYLKGQICRKCQITQKDVP